MQGLYKVLIMPKHGWSLNMREYTLITLNMHEYTRLWLNKQSSEYARILNMYDGVHNIRTLYKLLSSYRDKHIQTLSNI